MSSTPSRYRVLESLGRGGVGDVFLAEALAADETARQRLHREARSAAALDHPFICKVYEIADFDGRSGIVMEHFSGKTRAAVLRESALGAPEALRIAGAWTAPYAVIEGLAMLGE